MEDFAFKIDNIISFCWKYFGRILLIWFIMLIFSAIMALFFEDNMLLMNGLIVIMLSLTGLGTICVLTVGFCVVIILIMMMFEMW